MAGYLAFDREALAMLRLTLDLAVGELTATLGSDPAAAAARASIQGTISTIGYWSPILRGLSGCTAMEGYRPVNPESGDLVEAWWGQLASGRTLVTDPLSGTANVVTVEQARALAGALRTGELDRFLDDDQDWLIDQLRRIGASTETSAAFIRSLGPRRFTELVEEITEPMRLEAVLVAEGLDEPGPPAQFAILDVLGRTFGRFRVVAEDREKPAWGDALDEVSPIARLRMIRAGVDLDGAWSDAALIEAVSTALAGIDPATSLVPLDAVVGAEAIWLLSDRPSAAREFLESGEQQLVEAAVLHYDAAARGAMLIASQRFDPPDGDSVRLRESMLRVVAILTDVPTMLGVAYAPAPMATSLPGRLVEYLSPYFAELLNRPELTGLSGSATSSWTGGTGATDPAHFFRAVFIDEDVEAAFETWAWATYAKASTLGEPDALNAAAFVVSASHDLVGASAVGAIATIGGDVDGIVTLAGHLPIVGTIVGGVNDVIGGPVLDRLGLDIRDAIARGDVDHVNLELLLKWTAIKAWAGRQPSTTWDRPLTQATSTTIQAADNATGDLDAFDAAVEAWIIEQGLDPDQADEVKGLMVAIGSGSGRGEKFSSGG